MRYNLFELAEKQLIKEKKAKIIPCYTELDVIEYAVQIRKFLDDNKQLRKIIKLTENELKRNRRASRMRCYYKQRI